MFKPPKKILSFFIMLLLGACSIMPQPKTPAESLGVTYAMISRLGDLTAVRLSAGAITSSQALSILKDLENAKELTDSASLALARGMPEDTLSTLQIVTALLTELEVRLAKPKTEATPTFYQTGENYGRA